MPRKSVTVPSSTTAFPVSRSSALWKTFEKRDENFSRTMPTKPSRHVLKSMNVMRPESRPTRDTRPRTLKFLPAFATSVSRSLASTRLRPQGRSPEPGDAPSTPFLFSRLPLDHSELGGNLGCALPFGWSETAFAPCRMMANPSATNRVESHRPSPSRRRPEWQDCRYRHPLVASACKR